MNSRQAFINISKDGVTVEGKKVQDHGYINASQLPENLEIDDVHTYFIDLEEELSPEMSLTIMIHE